MGLGEVGRGDANIPGIPPDQNALHNRADDGLLSLHEVALARVRDEAIFPHKMGSKWLRLWMPSTYCWHFANFGVVVRRLQK